jgi:hypothetical protein
MAIQPLMDEAQKANREFDEMVASNFDKNKLMASTVHKIFKKAYSFTDMLGYYDMGDKLIAAQAMTDVLMKNLSPATLEPETYESFVNGYVFNNPGKFEDVTQMDGTEPVFMDAKKTYEEMNREVVQINDLSNQPEGKIVPPIQQAPSNGAPNLQINAK